MKKLIIVLLLSFFMINTALHASQSATRDDVINEVRRLMSDTNTDTSIRVWSDTVLHNRIDMAEDDINKLTRCLVTRSTIATTCGTAEYGFPDNTMVINRITYDTDGSSLTIKYVELKYKTIDTLDNENSGWEYTSSGTPNSYYYRGNYVGLYPAPDLKHSGDYGFLRLDYIVNPTTSTSSTALIFNGYNNLQTFKNCIIDYVCALCSIDKSNTNMINFWWNKYNTDVAIMNDRINNKPDKQ